MTHERIHGSKQIIYLIHFPEIEKREIAELQNWYLAVVLLTVNMAGDKSSQILTQRDIRVHVYY